MRCREGQSPHDWCTYDPHSPPTNRSHHITPRRRQCLTIFHSPPNPIPYPNPRPTRKQSTRAAFQATAFEADSSRTAAKTRVLAAERAIESAALAYGDPPAAVTFAESFLEDEKAFSLAMDAVSHGRFLAEHQAITTTTTTTTPSRDNNARQKRGNRGGGGGGEKAARALGGGGGTAKLAVGKKATGLGVAGATPGVGGTPGELSELLKGLSRGGGDGGGRGAGMREGWRQLPWLKEMGGFSLAAFLANR